MQPLEYIPERVAATLEASGKLDVSTARNLSKQYAQCGNCQYHLRDNVEGGQLVSNDVQLEGVCSNCGAENSILVEEKVWGIVSPDAEVELDSRSVRFDLDGRSLLIHPNHIYTTAEEPEE